MSFQVPRNVSSFTSSQRPNEDNHWRAAHRANGNAGGLGEKINDFFSDGKDLPMYKDKPSYATSRRRSFWQRRRIPLIALLGIVLLWWWLTSDKKQEITKGKDALPQEGEKLMDWLDKANPKHPKEADWESRRQSVREAFLISWDGYQKYAWGLDEYHPISKSGRNMVEGGMGWIIVDALDTAMIMNLTSCVKHARDWISTSLHYEANHEVNTFETTIRMLGGLLSAHYLSTTFPNLAPLTEDDTTQPGEDLYIEKAVDLADRILGAFNSPTGIPYASVNLNTSVGVGSHIDGGASSTAEAATVQLELKYLAKLTGEAHYWEKAERVIEVIDLNNRPGGLLPIFIYPESGGFKGENIRLGSRGDSYYEYLIKQYLQTSKEEPVYLDLWDEALTGIKQHLLVYSQEASLTVLAERPSGLDNRLSPKMDHLVCFMPGTIALGVTSGHTIAEAKAAGTWTAADEENMRVAKELMKTCWAMYKATTTGLAPEITYFAIDDPPRMYEDVAKGQHGSRFGSSGPSRPAPRPISTPLDDAADAEWRSDIEIHGNDEHNLQRPETVESLFYMWRITGDEMYREWGWEMFKSFVKYTAYPDPSMTSSQLASDSSSSMDTMSQVYAFTSLQSANKPSPDTKPLPRRDNMESFWLAETLKYFYLLFSPNDLLPLDQIVFNTEAHPFPNFEMGKAFKTGWTRGVKRDSSAMHEHEHAVEEVIGEDEEPAVKVKEIEVKVTQSAAAKVSEELDGKDEDQQKVLEGDEEARGW